MTGCKFLAATLCAGILFLPQVLAASCKTATVQSGGTCAAIAQAANITVAQLQSFNPGVNCSALQVGQTLCISSGTLPGQPQTNPDGSCATYTTVSGDSCSAIATRFFITVANIETWNANTFKWTGCAGLQVGFTMCVSAGTPPPIPIDPNAQCGPTSKGNLTCPLNICCSAFGFCAPQCVTRAVVESVPYVPHGANPCVSNCGIPTLPSCSTTPARKMGYYAGWANRRACTTFSPTQLDLTGYTHVMFAFATINQDLTIGLAGNDVPLLQELVSLKSSFSGLKVLIAVGGWAFSAIFINSVKSFLTQFKLDGIDIDVEYPAAIERNAPATDTPNLTSFFSEMRTALPSTIISAATPAGYWFLKGFQINKILSSVSWLNMMSYDYHGPWDTNVTGQAPVTNPQTSILDMQDSARLYIKAGIDLSKVNLGLAFYGRTYHLANPSCTGYNCTMVGGGAAGQCTETSGILAQFEVLSLLGSATPTLDTASQTYWFNKNGDLITFDQSATWTAKQQFAAKICFGGTFVWSFDQVAPTKAATPIPTTTSTTSSTTFPSPTGCASIGSAAKGQANQLMNQFITNLCTNDGQEEDCGAGAFVDGSDPQIGGRMWTDVTTYLDLINEQSWLPIPGDSKSAAPGDVDWDIVGSSFDDVGWAGLTYVKVQQYHNAHSGALVDGYLAYAQSVFNYLAAKWDSSTCGGGMPQQKGAKDRNTITTELFFNLATVLFLETHNQTYMTWANTAADWFMTGKGNVAQDGDGLWFDGVQAGTCIPISPKWSYNQGVIVSAFGNMFKITGQQKYKDIAAKTIDGVVGGGASSNDIQVVNGIMKEASDDVTGCKNQCGDIQDHYAFKGIFMKHLQYFLDAVADNALAFKYASFIGAQASAIIHFATGSDGAANNCWYAPNQGGAAVNPKTKNSGLDGLLAGLKYARC